MNDEAKFIPCKQSVVEVFTRKDVGQPWKSVGTGVVVSDQQCVTCFHVLFPDENQEVQDARKVIQEGKIQVKVRFFPDGNGSGKADLTSSNELADNERLVSVTPISNMKEFDLAVLSWQGARPAGVEIAVLSKCDDLTAKEFRIYGFAKSGNATSSRLETGKFLNRGAKNGDFWQFDSDHVGPGFSGAAIFDESTTQVLGIVLGAVTPGKSRCRALGGDKIRELCPNVDFEGNDVDHAGPRERIKNNIESRLESDAVVRNAIAKAFKFEGADDSENLCERLLNCNMTVSDFAKRFTQVIRDFRASKQIAAKTTAIDVYVGFLAGVFKQGVVRELRRALQQGQKVLALETYSTSIADLLLAAVNGELECLTVCFNDPSPIKHKHSVYVRERPGIDSPQEQARTQEDVEKKLVECMGLSWADFQLMRPEERRRELDAAIDMFTYENKRLVLIDDNGWSEVVGGKIPLGYSALVVVQLKKPLKPDEDAQARALTPFKFAKDNDNST